MPSVDFQKHYRESEINDSLLENNKNPVYDYKVIVDKVHVATFLRVEHTCSYKLVDLDGEPILNKINKKEFVAKKQIEFWPIYDRVKGVLNART